MNRYDIRCDCCGRFIPYSQFETNGGASSCFVPDSDVSYEECFWRCKVCTDKNGTPIPLQSGMVLEICCSTC